MFEALAARDAGLCSDDVAIVEKAFSEAVRRLPRTPTDGDLRVLNSMVRCAGIAELRFRRRSRNPVKAIADEALGYLLELIK